MFTGMTKLSKYNAQSGQFGSRDKTTVAPFAELNREALGLVVDSVLKFTNKKSLEEINDPELVQLLSGLNFGKLYGHVLFKLGAGRDGAFKTNQGQWVVYKQGSDHMRLLNHLKVAIQVGAQPANQLLDHNLAVVIFMFITVLMKMAKPHYPVWPFACKMTI